MSGTFLLLLALGVAAPALKDPPPKTAPIVGKWEVESQTFAGRPRALAAGGTNRYEFLADGTWILSRGARRVGSADRAYTADPHADPPTIDLKYDPAQQDGRIVRGIFKVERDRLVLCQARGDGPRPTAFESTADVPTTLYIFKRCVPED